MKKRIISIISLIIVLAMLPVGAFAQTGEAHVSYGKINPTNIIETRADAKKTSKYKTGLYKVDGIWKYYENGKFKTVTGLVQRPDNKKWYYVEKGIKKIATGLVKRVTDGKWCYVEKGEFKSIKRALVPRVSNPKRWFYVENGMLKKYTGTITARNGKYKYYLEKGELTGALPGGKTVNWIGDSHSIYGKFENKYSGVDWHVQGRKKFGLTINNNKCGIEIFKKLDRENKIRAFLVIELGTNPSKYKCESKFEEDVIYIMKNVPKNTRVIFMTSKSISNHSKEYGYSNRILKNLKMRYPNMYIVDWASKVQRGWYDADGVHYTAEGYEKMFGYFKGQLKKAGMDRLISDSKGGIRTEPIML